MWSPMALPTRPTENDGCSLDDVYAQHRLSPINVRSPGSLELSKDCLNFEDSSDSCVDSPLSRDISGDLSACASPSRGARSAVIVVTPAGSPKKVESASLAEGKLVTLAPVPSGSTEKRCHAAVVPSGSPDKSFNCSVIHQFLEDTDSTVDAVGTCADACIDSAVAAPLMPSSRVDEPEARLRCEIRSTLPPPPSKLPTEFPRQASTDSAGAQKPPLPSKAGSRSSFVAASNPEMSNTYAHATPAIGTASEHNQSDEVACWGLSLDVGVAGVKTHVLSASLYDLSTPRVENSGNVSKASVVPVAGMHASTDPACPADWADALAEVRSSGLRSFADLSARLEALEGQQEVAQRPRSSKACNLGRAFTSPLGSAAAKQASPCAFEYRCPSPRGSDRDAAGTLEAGTVAEVWERLGEVLDSHAQVREDRDQDVALVLGDLQARLGGVDEAVLEVSRGLVHSVRRIMALGSSAASETAAREILEQRVCGVESGLDRAMNMILRRPEADPSEAADGDSAPSAVPGVLGRVPCSAAEEALLAVRQRLVQVRSSLLHQQQEAKDVASRRRLGSLHSLVGCAEAFNVWAAAAAAACDGSRATLSQALRSDPQRAAVTVGAAASSSPSPAVAPCPSQSATPTASPSATSATIPVEIPFPGLEVVQAELRTSIAEYVDSGMVALNEKLTSWKDGTNERVNALQGMHAEMRVAQQDFRVDVRRDIDARLAEMSKAQAQHWESTALELRRSFEALADSPDALTAKDIGEAPHGGCLSREDRCCDSLMEPMPEQACGACGGVSPRLDDPLCKEAYGFEDPEKRHSSGEMLALGVATGRVKVRLERLEEIRASKVSTLKAADLVESLADVPNRLAALEAHQSLALKELPTTSPRTTDRRASPAIDPVVTSLSDDIRALRADLDALRCETQMQPRCASRPGFDGAPVPKRTPAFGASRSRVRSASKVRSLFWCGMMKPAIPTADD